MRKLRTILHLDMDAFFASIEQRDRPELQGKPVIVGGPVAERGVVATCSYEARKFGVHSAMPTLQAKRLCPNGIYLPVDHKKYKAVSKQIFAILEQYTPLIEPLSIDEAFLDMTGCNKLFGSGQEIARQIKHVIRTQLQLTASVGISYNKFLAKLASDLDKPDGIIEITPHDLSTILHPLPVSRLWGIGNKSAEKLKHYGLHTIGDVASMDVAKMRRYLGQLADHIYQLANGIDERPVTTHRETKSISQETTFATDITDRSFLETILLAQSEYIARKLRRANLESRTITLKLRYAPFRTTTKQQTLPVPTAHDLTIYETAKQLLTNSSVSQTDSIRLIGISAGQLTPTGHSQQISLFDDIETQTKHTELSKAIDTIKDKFGDHILTRASLLQKTNDSNSNKSQILDI